jgi:predicted dehydrogenase
MSMVEAKSLAVLSKQNKVLLASAPCSVLSQAAQTMRQAVHDGVAGRPLLVYAELDDGFVPQAPYRNWLSESGAPWPFEDEFRVGCTIEHAGYSLTWLIAMFGSVQKVVAASASLIPDKERVGGGAPDFATSTLFFENGIVARLTCSIVAPHDHKLRVIGTKGVVEVRDVWHNSANVFFRPRFKIRNRLIDSPIPRKVKPLRSAHVKSWSSGSASMNFALGPHEMITSIREKRPCHLSTEFALHVTEVTLAINDGCGGAGMQTMTTRCAPLAAPNANS